MQFDSEIQKDKKFKTINMESYEIEWNQFKTSGFVL